MYSIVEGRVRSCQCSKRWHHRVATDLRNMRGEESVMDPCLWTFRDENGVMHALCLVHVDDFMLACSDSPFEKVSFIASTICTNGKSGSHECSHNAANESHKLTINHIGTWRGFEIRFTEYAKEISIITLPSYRRRDRKSQITPLELSSTSSLEWSVCFGWVCNVCHNCWHLCSF